MSRALDLILVGRAVGAAEALQLGLANRIVPAGEALALQIAGFPQTCMRNDRGSAYQQWELSEEEAIANEFQHGLATLRSGETQAGAGRLTAGVGRHGEFSK